MPALAISGRAVGMGGQMIVPGTVAPATDATITFARVAPVRAAANRFELGITFTQDTFPSGAVSSARTAAKALMTAVDWDYINMHNHLFGASGPWTNTDKNAGKTYATRATWTGWTSWDARLQHVRDCAGATTKIIISLLPPGWMKMDGGTKAQWDTLDNVSDERVTDLHVTDMNDLARAIKDRHADVKYFSVFNEQKGNFAPHNDAAKADHGLSGTMDYVFEEIWAESLRVALDGDGFTDIEIMGPYLVLEANGVDALAATYIGSGFPQPRTAGAGGAHVPDFYLKSSDSGNPLSARDKTFLEYYQANVNAATRDDWLAVDYKTLGAENDVTNWAVLRPWRWYLLESFLAQLTALKAITGYVAGTTKIIAMEAYARKVQDEIEVPSDQEQAALSAELLRLQLQEGIKAELRWAPEQGAGKTNRLNLFTSTTDALVDGGGVALPLYAVYKAFADNFRSVDVYSTVSSDSKKVTAVASPTKTLVINHLPNPLTVAINSGAPLSLGGHEVRVVTA